MAIIRKEGHVTSAPVTVTFAGAGWTGANAANQTYSDPACSGSNMSFTYGANDTATYAVAAGSGFTGCLLVGRCTYAGDPNITVIVDGVTHGTWSQQIVTQTAGVPQYFLYWYLYKPIDWITTDPTGANAHTIVVRCSGGGQLCIDCLDFYDAARNATLESVYVFGNSLAYGSDPTNPPTGQYASPAGMELARLLGLGSALNAGVNAADLTNGQNGAYGPGGVSNMQFFSNGAVALPDYSRAYGNWNNDQRRYGVLFHQHNDVGYSQLYNDPVGWGYTDNHSNGAAPWKSGSVIYWNPPITSSGGNAVWTLNYNSLTTVISYTDAVSVINNKMQSANIPYTCFRLGQDQSVGPGCFYFIANNARAEPAGATNGLITQTNVLNVTTGAYGQIQPNNNETVLLHSGSVPPTSGTFTTTWGSKTATHNVGDTAAQMNTTFGAAGLPYSAASITGTALITANSLRQFTSSAFAYGSHGYPLTFNFANVLPVNHTLTVSSDLVVGRNAAPAGTGWAENRFFLRLREMLWRRQMSVRDGFVLCVPSPPSNDLNVGANQYYNLLIQRACADPSVKNAVCVDIWNALSSGSGPGNNQGTMNADGVHYTQAGHSVVGSLLYDAVRMTRLEQQKVRAAR